MCWHVAIVAVAVGMVFGQCLDFQRIQIQVDWAEEGIEISDLADVVVVVVAVAFGEDIVGIAASMDIDHVVAVVADAAAVDAMTIPMMEESAIFCSLHVLPFLEPAAATVVVDVAPAMLDIVVVVSNTPRQPSLPPEDSVHLLLNYPQYDYFPLPKC